jgi:hypothetical protein
VEIRAKNEETFVRPLVTMIDETVIDNKFWNNFLITSPNARMIVNPLVTFVGQHEHGCRELCFHSGSKNLFISLDFSQKYNSVPATLSLYDSSQLIALEYGDWLKPKCLCDLKDLLFEYFLDQP